MAFRTIRRRVRKIDPLASTSSVRSVIDELRRRCPDIIPKTDKRLFSLLGALKHFHQYSATDTHRGRTSKWSRTDLLTISQQLQAILLRETGGRISLSSFISLYVRILLLPVDICSALEQGLINLQEAHMLARLSYNNLDVHPSTAQSIRKEVLTSHLTSQGSQNSLRQRVKEILGEANVVSTEAVVATVETVDKLLAVDAADKRHLFYEQMKDLFYALREIRPEDLDDKALDDFGKAADNFFSVLRSIQLKRRQRKNLHRQFST